MADGYEALVYRTTQENQMLGEKLMSMPWCPTQIPHRMNPHLCNGTP
jgi:hypothetical protein